MLLKVIALLSIIYLSNWVFKDAKNRGIHSGIAGAWVISLLLVPYISLPAYFIYRAFTRPKLGKGVTGTLCSKCGEENKNETSCKSCGNTLAL